MHPDEANIDTALVAQLLLEQMPRWAGLPLKYVDSPGTSNAIYRLGEDMSVRLPLTPGAAKHVDKEFQWVPKLASLLPVAVPLPLARGTATDQYPWSWTVCRWIEGTNPDVEQLEEPNALASDLARFVLALHEIDMKDGPTTNRGFHPKLQDEATRTAIEALAGKIDTAAALRAWEEVLLIPEWVGAPVWIHGDLMPGNLLVKDGRLSAVLDFGSLGIGDPAIDMIPAWNLLPPDTRAPYRQAVDVDDATWARGRGWALTMALLQLPYYEHSNPALAANARHAIQAILTEA